MYCKNFSELSNRDAAIAGGKGASLGEMTNAGIPVPPGFVVLADAFEKFLDVTNLNTEIDAILHTVKTDEMRSVEHASERVQKLILESKMPEDIGEEIVADFELLDAEHVAVRSSATAEDSNSAAWAGQLDTYLNTTHETLLTNVQRCWASLFTSRAIFYRFEKDLHTTKISVAVVVQKMIQSEVSGIAFSVHPVTEDRNQLIIEAGFGLGEAIVSGQITPDSYVVEKSPRRIIDKNIVEQERGIYRKEKGEVGEMGALARITSVSDVGGNEWRSIPVGKRSEQKLSDEQILELSELIIHIEKHYGFPCDIEWALEDNVLYITQSRPITTLSGGQSDGLSHQNELLPLLSSEHVVLSKIYTRERPLFYFSVFPDGERSGIRKYFDWDIEDILVIFPPKNRPGEVWYPKRLLEEIELSGAEKMKRDPALTHQVIIDAEVAWEKLVPYLINDQPIRNIEEANSYYQYLVDFWKVLNTIFFFLVDKNELSREFSESLLAVRDKTQHYTAKMSTVFLNFIDTQYPDFSSVSPYMTPGEVSELSESSTAAALLLRLRDRAKEGCFIYQDVLYPFSQLEDILIQNNLVFEQEHNISDSQIQGQVAYQGKVVGRVRNIRSRVELEDVVSGDILVATVTDAHYVQAMQRAGAFVTDEGGIMCHAAIVAREMKKPCIIGTKIATQVLQDGDLVEVDANEGVVRVLERALKEERINVIILKKNYSRDLSLILEQLWVNGFKRLMLKYRDYKNPYEPYVIFFVNGENMEIWENEQAIHFFQNWLLEKNKQGTDFLQGIIHEYEKLVVMLEGYWRDGGVSDHVILKKYLEISERAAGLFFAWYYTGTDDRMPKTALKMARDLREKDEFFAKNDKYIKECVVALGGKAELANLIFVSEFPEIPSEDELRQRVSGVVVVDGDKEYFSSLLQFSEDYPKYEFEGLRTVVDLVDEFSGWVAQRGRAKGTVRIVKNQRNVERVHVGDIIVSPMTTPDFLPAMKKASAFITDEGGITCHAAIVAREMKKPCIIGTKIATQVLKDGDLVEVDACPSSGVADNGVVRVLERAKDSEGWGIEKKEAHKEYILINQDVDTSMLTLEMTWAGMDTEHFAIQTGHRLSIILEMVKGTTINAYMPKEEFEQSVPVCAKVLLTKPKVRAEILKKTEQTTKAIREYAIEVMDVIGTASHRELAAILIQIHTLQARAVEWGTVIAFADIFGEISNAGAEILRKKELPLPAHVCSHILSHPQNGTLTEQAMKDIRNSKKVDDQLLAQYFWLEQGYIGRGLTKSQLEEIRSHQEPDERHTLKRSELITQLQMTGPEVLVFDVAHDLIYCKSLRADSRQFLHVVTNQIVDRLAAELGMEPDILESLTTNELAVVLRGEAEIPNTLTLRYMRSVFMPTESGGYAIMIGEEAVQYIQEHVHIEKLNDVTECRGQIAHQGKVRGSVRLVFGPQHNAKVHVGDILVSSATSPQLLPAMKRAAAFVTNVGGITSHAAIVARELKKPCIVGTKIATQILKDGDLVEVDADNGVVRIIEKAKL